MSSEKRSIGVTTMNPPAHWVVLACLLAFAPSFAAAQGDYAIAFAGASPSLQGLHLDGDQGFGTPGACNGQPVCSATWGVSNDAGNAIASGTVSVPDGSISTSLTATSATPFGDPPNSPVAAAAFQSQLDYFACQLNVPSSYSGDVPVSFHIDRSFGGTTTYLFGLEDQNRGPPFAGVSFSNVDGPPTATVSNCPGCAASTTATTMSFTGSLMFRHNGLATLYIATYL